MVTSSQTLADPMPPWPDAARGSPKAYLVGGGIASMAAAAFLIRDGDMLGQDITILEETNKVGGSLDGAGSPKVGYVLRGGRMIERKYVCTFDLFSSIPTLDGSRSVTDEIYAWNETMKTASRSRLVRNGQRQTAPDFGLSERHILTIERLAVEPEGLLGKTTIADQFDSAFFRTNFWFMWCTTFAFQPWHSAVEFKRYLVRFAHMVSGFDRLEGIMRTVYNQFDSLVRPLQQWLDERGVVFALDTRVTHLGFRDENGGTTVTRIATVRGGRGDEVMVEPDDLVLVTLGSMTEGSRFGSMRQAPALDGEADARSTGVGSWDLWKAIAKDRPAFGNPSAFANHVGQSKWLSFTTTLYDSALLKVVRDLTGNVPGEGGLITFPDSPWLMSIVIPHQPHFIGQPADVAVLWGYGLKVDEFGDFVRKPMSACTGLEIMTELLGHLHVTEETPHILETCLCIPCMMPFITSQFLPRQSGDRPEVIPAGSKNLAFIGQFCELPEDVVFTVEYSVRSAQTAVYRMLGLEREPPPVYKGCFDPRVLFKAFLALHDIHA
ncbi:oleate hydratase [Lichenihabitans psoromatis]|uniref:oleate hydratase n=1 Tax=Lichenihabitans psoromatis TaxID=2528642 RepID=UPI00315C9C0A